METTKKSQNDKERDILFSHCVKAGPRLYYIDVKKNRQDEMYLSLTESKKTVTGDPDMPQVTYEKHKIFIYPEDFGKFLVGFQEALDYIGKHQGETEPREEPASGEIKIDMDF